MSSRPRTKLRAGSHAVALAMGLSLAAALGACSDIYHDRRESIEFSAGDSVASNRAIMMVDTWPAASANKEIAFNGEKMQTAVERYRHNRVIPPVNIATTNRQGQQAQEAAPSATPAAAPAAPVK